MTYEIEVERVSYWVFQWRVKELGTITGAGEARSILDGRDRADEFCRAREAARTASSLSTVVRFAYVGAPSIEEIA